MYLHTCANTCAFVCARIWVYICTRVGAFRFFVLSNPSTTCVCITGVFSTPALVCGGGLEVGDFFSMVSVCNWRGGYVLTGVEI